MFNILSWLGSYRTLPAQLADAESARIKAEDDARYWRGKAEVWEQQAYRAQSEKDITHRLLIDWCALKVTGMPIFGGGPTPQAKFYTDEVADAPRGGKRLARDIINDTLARMEQEIKNGTITRE